MRGDCWNCGGRGHPARLCPSKSVNDVENEDEEPEIEVVNVEDIPWACHLYDIDINALEEVDEAIDTPKQNKNDLTVFD